MKIKNISRILAFLMIFLLTGCSINMEPNNLMRPPHSTSDGQDEIQKTIEQAAGSEILYKHPKRGEFRYSITLFDINDDGRQEAIAFYKDKKNPENVCVMILDNYDGEWNQGVSFNHQATDVDTLLFHDFDKDGIFEIVIGWSEFSVKNNLLSVYRYGNDSFKEFTFEAQSFSETSELNFHEPSAVNASNYSEFVLYDLDIDGEKELITVDLNPIMQTAYARIWSLEKGELFVCREMLNLDGTVLEYKNCRIQNLAADTHAIFLDAVRSDGMIATEVILYDDENQKYTAPLSRKKQKFEERYASFASKDINGDMLIEIPTQSLLPGYNEYSDSKLYLTTWNNYDYRGENTMAPVFSAVHNVEEGYFFILEDEWVYNFTAKIDSGNHSMTFYTVDRTSSMEVFGNALFELRVCQSADWEVLEADGYVKIIENNNKIYCAKIHDFAREQFEMNYYMMHNYLKLFN